MTGGQLTKLVEAGVIRKEVADAALEERRKAERLGLDLVVGGLFSLARDMGDTTYVVRPLFVQGQLVAETARPGHGKSSLSIAVAFAHALRRPLGPLLPGVAGLVYIVSAEDQIGTRARAYAEAVRHELDEDDRKALDENLRWIHVNRMVHPSSILEAIAADAAGRDVALIFVDTGPATFQGDDENSNTAQQDQAAAWRSGTFLPGKPCVVVLGHPAKGATAENLTPRGGGAYEGSIDANITLWRDDDMVVTVSHTKLRSEHFEPIKFRLDPVSIEFASGAVSRVPIVRPVTDAEADEIDLKLGERRESILVALLDANESLSGRDIARRARGHENKNTTVMRDLERLAAGGRRALVSKGQLTDKYGLTAVGRKAAKALADRQARTYREATSGR